MKCEMCENPLEEKCAVRVYDNTLEPDKCSETDFCSWSCLAKYCKSEVKES